MSNVLRQMGQQQARSGNGRFRKTFMRRQRFTRTAVPGLGESVTSTWHAPKQCQSETVRVLMPPAGEREAKMVVAPATKD